MHTSILLYIAPCSRVWQVCPRYLSLQLTITMDTRPDQNPHSINQRPACDYSNLDPSARPNPLVASQQ
ncbi:hypothetical protein BDW67DRAFT_163627 [Aspergillus spinulosporus]